MRTGLLAAAGWVVAATLTLGASWSAVQVVRSAVAPEDLAVSPTDSLPVPTESPGASRPPTGPRPSATAPGPTGTSPAGRLASRSGTGGTAVFRCVGGVPRLVSATPRQGFAVAVDDTAGEVKFDSDRHRTEIKASCAGGEPQLAVEESNRGRGGSGSG